MQGIEYADLDIGMGCQGRNGAVLAVAGRVVEQNAKAYAAVGSLEHFIHQHACADAVMHDVVLQVDAALSVADQFGPRGEGFSAVRQQTKTRLPLIRRGLRLDRATERGIRRRQYLARLNLKVEVGTTA
ncbi:hypothetical protein D3C84_826310 [compost metagenome]